MNNPIIENVVRHLSNRKRWDWDETKPHLKDVDIERKLIHDREWKFLGLHIMDFWPGKERPTGWAILWHKWNKGISISYLPPALKTYNAMIKEGDLETPAGDYRVQLITEHPTFWQRKLPKGWMFTIGKMVGKWHITKNQSPFMYASLMASPLISAEEWAELGKDGHKIHDKDAS